MAEFAAAWLLGSIVLLHATMARATVPSRQILAISRAMRGRSCAAGSFDDRAHVSPGVATTLLVGF
jgi:hypothetical protein